jgi:hypothetical protein
MRRRKEMKNLINELDAIYSGGKKTRSEIALSNLYIHHEAG